MSEKIRMSIAITADLRRQLEEAREGNGAVSIYHVHTLSSEIEELLRIGLKARAGGGYVTVRLDDGLLAWLDAYVKGVGLAGSIEDTAIYFIRQGLIAATQSKHIMDLCRPHLPESIQKALNRE